MLQTAFNWFLGKNHLKQIMYNPKTGGCYDGLEKENININQGAESTICYLMARIIMEKYKPLTIEKLLRRFESQEILLFKSVNN